ncbi:hydroxyacid dehydrogenase [Phytoactinopolyspora endophytica]|uniref:hydroxyacid dehydrogenase n=1 Tax=Phytoactinopolyspora endophytica TaxID=1642495 RepID=UPI00101CADB1|nr:hydroxyacid dehydrogenase [Phytoactinopolyspora endophytica]
MHQQRPQTLVAMGHGIAERVLTGAVVDRLVEVADVDPALVASDFDTHQVRKALARAEVLLTSWGCPPLTEEVLSEAPRLRAVVHAAGTVKMHVTDACWDRGIRVSSAATANAMPVAEYTVAAVLWANKRVLEIGAEYQRSRTFIDWGGANPDLGNYGKTVGVVGASRVGRRVMELLRHFDLRVLLADPYVHGEEGAAYGASVVPLDELLAASDVVSVHAPDIPSTRHLIDADGLAGMRDGSVLINTARPAVIDQQALTNELVSGRLSAILDVTSPEPLPPDSILYDLPNVFLTPHVAGSLGGELARIAETAVDELERYSLGLPFVHEVKPEELERSA